MRLTLPTKTALLTTLLVLLLVGAAGAWQYHNLSGQYVALMQRQQQDFAQLAAGDIDYKISSHLDALAHEARSADATLFLSAEKQRSFLDRTDLRSKFDGIALVAADGAVLVNDPTLSKAVSIADREYFERARASGLPVISAPLYARTTDLPAIVMMVPVKDTGGQPVGYVAASLRLKQANVLGIVARARMGNGSYFLIETTGAAPVFVVHPDARQVLTPARQSAKAADDLTTSAPIPSTGWILRVVLPAATAYAPLDHARAALVAQMIVLGVLSSLLVWAGTVWLMRPMARLHGAIRALRQAPDRAVALDVRANDERGDLAREFTALITELRNQRTEMAAITDASPMGLFRSDLQGRMVYVNDAYLAIHGLARDEAPQGWLALVPEAAREGAWRTWLGLMSGTEPYHVTRWLRRGDGDDLLVSLHMRPMLSEGEVVGQAGTISDITQATRAEQALRTLTTIFEVTTDYVVQLDKQGKLTYMNPAARKVTGIALDAPIDHLAMADFNPPATVARLGREAVPTAVSQGAWVGESYIWDAQHNEFPVSHMVLAHRDRSGKVERFSGIMRDISAAKATELALLESAGRLRTMADALPMRVAYVDAGERYRFVNLAYDNVFGLPRDSIPGKTVREVFGEAGYRAAEPHIRAVLAGVRTTFEREAASATDFTCFEVTYVPQPSVDGSTVIGFHAVTIDVTRQKREERRLSQLASQDPLTGLGNRSAFEVRLAEAMEQCSQRSAVMALLYLDLDRFKQINDRWGHPCGDDLLRAVAARLAKATRGTDFVARLGGDEFTVILQGLNHIDDAGRVAQKIVESLRDPYVLDDKTLRVSASVGVACYAGGAMTSDALIRKADEMLYQAKGAGRNNFQVALPPDAGPS